MRLIHVLCLLLLSLNSYSVEPPPSGCKTIHFSGSTVVLSKESPSLVLLHNLSDVDLWVTHPIIDPGASAGWSSRLEPKHWSALALNNKTFELGCIESKPGHEQQISCAGVLAICRWEGMTDASLAQKEQVFWAVENMPLPDLLESLNQRGFKKGDSIDESTSTKSK